MYMVGYGRVRHGAFFNYFRVQKRVWVWMGECVSECMSECVSEPKDGTRRNGSKRNNFEKEMRWTWYDVMWCGVMVCNGKKKKKQKRRLQLLNTMVIKLQASSISYSPIPTGRNPGCEQYTEGGGNRWEKAASAAGKKVWDGSTIQSWVLMLVLAPWIVPFFSFFSSSRHCNSSLR